MAIAIDDGVEVVAKRRPDAMAAAKGKGKNMGRPAVMTAETRRRIRKLRDRGMSYEIIATYLNERGIATDGGSQWWSSSVRRACLPR